MRVRVVRLEGRDACLLRTTVMFLVVALSLLANSIAVAAAVCAPTIAVGLSSSSPVADAGTLHLPLTGQSSPVRRAGSSVDPIRDLANPIRGWETISYGQRCFVRSIGKWRGEL